MDGQNTDALQEWAKTQLQTSSKKSKPTRDNPAARQKILNAAKRAKQFGYDIPEDVADDFYELTALESGRAHYLADGKTVKTGVKTPNGDFAIGFSQVMGNTARPYKAKGLDPYDEEQNIIIGLSEFQKGGADSVARRLAYVGGVNSPALKKYQRTGEIPKGKLYSYLPNNKETFETYIKNSGGLKPLENWAENQIKNPSSATDDLFNWADSQLPPSKPDQADSPLDTGNILPREAPGQIPKTPAPDPTATVPPATPVTPPTFPVPVLSKITPELSGDEGLTKSYRLPDENLTPPPGNGRTAPVPLAPPTAQPPRKPRFSVDVKARVNAPTVPPLTENAAEIAPPESTFKPGTKRAELTRQLGSAYTGTADTSLKFKKRPTLEDIRREGIRAAYGSDGIEADEAFRQITGKNLISNLSGDEKLLDKFFDGKAFIIPTEIERTERTDRVVKAYQTGGIEAVKALLPELDNQVFADRLDAQNLTGAGLRQSQGYTAPDADNKIRDYVPSPQLKEREAQARRALEQINREAAIDDKTSILNQFLTNPLSRFIDLYDMATGQFGQKAQDGVMRSAQEKTASQIARYGSANKALNRIRQQSELYDYSNPLIAATVPARLAGQFTQGAVVDNIAPLLKTTGLLTAAVDRYVLGNENADASKTLPFVAGESMTNTFREGLGDDTGFGYQVSRGLGQVFGMILFGAGTGRLAQAFRASPELASVTNALRSEVPLAPGLSPNAVQRIGAGIGVAQVASEGYDLAKAKGATEPQALLVALVSSPAGLLEGVTEGKVLGRLDNLKAADALTDGLFSKQFLKIVGEKGTTAVADGSTEFFTETAQQFANSAAVNLLASKNPSLLRAITEDFDNAMRDSFTAFFTGAGTSIGGAAVESRLREPESDVSADPSQVSPGVSTAEQNLERVENAKTEEPLSPTPEPAQKPKFAFEIRRDNRLRELGYADTEIEQMTGVEKQRIVDGEIQAPTAEVPAMETPPAADQPEAVTAPGQAQLPATETSAELDNWASETLRQNAQLTDPQITDPQPIKQEDGADIYFETDNVKAYDGSQYGKKFVVSMGGNAKAEEFETAAEAVTRARELESELAASKGKADWQITKRIFDAQGKNTGTSNRHKTIVESALKENKTVPFEVLAEYPDLAARYAQDRQSQAQPQNVNPKPSPVKERARAVTKLLFKPQAPFTAETPSAPPQTPETVASGRTEPQAQEKIKTFKPRKRASANPKKHSLGTFVRLSGGIAPSKVIDLEPIRNAKQGKFTISRRGRSIEDVFRDAVAAGYFSGRNTEYSEGASGQSGNSYDFTIDDFVNAVADDLNGISRQYSAEAYNEADALGDMLPGEAATIERLADWQYDEDTLPILQAVEATGEITHEQFRKLVETAGRHKIARADVDHTIREIKAAAAARRAAETHPESTDPLAEGGSIFIEDRAETLDETEPDADDLDFSFDFGANEPASPAGQKRPRLEDFYAPEQSALFGAGDDGLFAQGGAQAVETPQARDTTTKADRQAEFARNQLAAIVGKETADFLIKPDGATQKIKTTISEDVLRNPTIYRNSNINEIIAPLTVLSRLRGSGQSVSEYLTQAGLFGGSFEELSRAQKDLLNSLDSGANAAEAVRDFIEKDADGDTLFKIVDNQSNAYNKVLNDYAQLDDLTPLITAIESEIRNGNEVKISLEAAEIVRTLMAAADKRDRKKMRAFAGGFLPPNAVETLTESVEAMAETLAEMGHSRAELDRLRDNLTSAAKGNGTVLLNVFDDAAPHERVHEAAFLGGNTVGNQKRIEAMPEYRKFRAALAKKENITNPSFAKVWNEALAWLTTAPAEKFGLTDEEAANLLTEIMAGYVEANGTESLKYFERLENEKLSEVIKNIYERRQRKAKPADAGAGGRNEKGVQGDPRSDGRERRRGQGETAGEDARNSQSKQQKEERRRELKDSEARKTEAVRNRRYAATLRENGRDVYDVDYNSESEKGWTAKAVETLSKSAEADPENPFAQAIETFNSDRLPDSYRVVLGNALIDYAGAAGDYKTMREVADRLINLVGTAAQALRASQMVSKYDFAKGFQIAEKALREKGETVSDDTVNKLRALTEKYAATEEEKQLLASALREAEDRAGESEAEAAELEKALSESKTKFSKDLANKQAQIRYWKEKAEGIARERAAASKVRKNVEELYQELKAKRPDLEAKISDAFKDEALMMAVETLSAGDFLAAVASRDPELSADVFDALRDIAALEILDNKTYADVIKTLEALTKGKVSGEELKQIHAAGEARTRAGVTISPTAAQNRRTRAEHRREAAKVRVKMQPPKPTRYEAETMAVAQRDGYTVEEISGAFILPKIKGKAAVADWKAQMQAISPNLSDADLNRILTRSTELKRTVEKDLEKKVYEAREDRDLTEKEILRLKRQRTIAQAQTRAARLSLERFYTGLKRSRGRKLAEGALSLTGLPKSLMSTGEISFILRQGFIPFVLNTREWAKGLKGVGKGMSSVEERLIYEENLRADEYFEEAERYGVIFSQVGKRPQTDEHFPAQVFERLAEADTAGRNILSKAAIKTARAQQRFEHAYTLPGDAMRLGLFKTYAKLLDDSALTPEEKDKGKRFAAYIANISVGKGSIEKAFGRDSLILKAVQALGFAPGYTLSRFESAFIYSPAGLVVAPKGMRKAMAKKTLRLYGTLGTVAVLLQALAAGLGASDDDEENVFSILDPKSKDFLKIRFAHDVRIDLTSNLSEGMKLFFADFMASGFYLARGENEKAADVWREEMNRYASGRFFRGKASPMASFGIDLIAGKDFVGRPINATEGGYWGAVTSRVLPLTYQQAYDGLLYSEADSILKEPQTARRAWERMGNASLKNAGNAAMIFILSGLGVGANQYAQVTQSEAEEKAWSMYEPLTGGKTDERTRRVEGGFRKLFRLSEQLKREGRDTTRLDLDIRRYAKSYDITGGKLAELRKQALQPKFSFVTERMTAEQIETILKYASESERPELEKIRDAKIKRQTLKKEREERLANRTLLEKTKRMTTDRLVDFYEENEESLSDDQKSDLKKLLRLKAESANKRGTLTGEETERIKTLLPDLSLPNIRPRRESLPKRSRSRDGFESLDVKP